MTTITTVTKKHRVDAAVRGMSLERAPASLWRHFYESEETAEGLAAAMLKWQRTYDWDWVKINPRASYHVEGWGVRLRFSGQPLIKPVPLEVPIVTSRDWARLKPQSFQSGALAEQLEAIARIRAGLGNDIYALETVFTPLGIAQYLVKSNDVLVDHIRTDPQAVHGALELITETFAEFVRRALTAGADGIYLGTTYWASRDTLTDDEYAEFGRPYDLRVLEPAQSAAFNVLHVCKSHNMLMKLLDYPVHALNWAVGSPGNPTLGEVQRATNRCVMGGLASETLLNGKPEAVRSEVESAARDVDPGRWILGPACSIAVGTPADNVAAARAAIER